MLLRHQGIIKPGCTESAVSVWISSLIGRCYHWSSVHPRRLKWAQGRCCGGKKMERSTSQVSALVLSLWRWKNLMCIVRSKIQESIESRKIIYASLCFWSWDTTGNFYFIEIRVFTFLRFPLIVQETTPYKERKIFKNKLLEIRSGLLIKLKPNREVNIEQSWLEISEWMKEWMNEVFGCHK